MKMIEGVEVPEGWRRLKLGEVAHSLKSGGTPSRDVLEFWGGNVPFVLIEDMTKTNKYLISTNETISEKGLKNSSAWIVPKYSILLSMYASLGEVVINKIDVATNQAILGIILKKDYNLEFMYYILRFNKRNYEKYTIQTTQKNLNKELVSQIFIRIPISLPEQHKIAEILGTVDNAIERIDTIIEKYKRIKQGMMQDLLTRGVVENDELGVMNYVLRDEKKHKFKDSPLGRIPEEWVVVELGGVAKKLKSGGTPSRDILDYWDGDIPFALIEDLTKNKYLDSTNETITEKGLKKSSAWIVPKNSILLSMYASLGEVVINKINVATNQAILGIILKEVYDLEFVYYLLKFNKSNYEKYTIQTTQKNLNKKIVSEFIISVPSSLSEQRKIAEILESIDNAIEKEQKYKEKVERIKQGLMDDLLTGKVRVKYLIEGGAENVQQA